MTATKAATLKTSQRSLEKFWEVVTGHAGISDTKVSLGQKNRAGIKHKLNSNPG